MQVCYFQHAVTISIRDDVTGHVSVLSIRQSGGVRYDDASKLQLIINDVRQMLEEHPDILADIERKLLQKHRLIEADAPAEPKPDAKAAAPAKGTAQKRARPN